MDHSYQPSYIFMTRISPLEFHHRNFKLEDGVQGLHLRLTRPEGARPPTYLGRPKATTLPTRPEKKSHAGRAGQHAGQELVLVQTLLCCCPPLTIHSVVGPRTRLYHTHIQSHTHRPTTTSWHFTLNCPENSGQLPHALSGHHDVA